MSSRRCKALTRQLYCKDFIKVTQSISQLTLSTFIASDETFRVLLIRLVCYSLFQSGKVIVTNGSDECGQARTSRSTLGTFALKNSPQLSTYSPFDKDCHFSRTLEICILVSMKLGLKTELLNCRSSIGWWLLAAVVGVTSHQCCGAPAGPDQPSAVGGRLGHVL